MQCNASRVHKVTVRQLKLTHYRNYCSFNIHLSGQHVVFTGYNGAGKTNLLEALSFLSPGRGLRRAAYSDISFSKGGGLHLLYLLVSNVLFMVKSILVRL